MRISETSVSVSSVSVTTMPRSPPCASRRRRAAWRGASRFVGEAARDGSGHRRIEIMTTPVR
jgi:hypothetical protein